MLLLTLQNVVLSFKEFLTVWINQVLFHNHVYPREVFSVYKAFELIVYKSRSPFLNAYINDLVNEFLSLLLKGRSDGGGKICELIIVVFDQRTNSVLHRYVVNCSQFVDLSKNVVDTAFLDSERNIQAEDNDALVLELPGFSWNEIYAQFRSVLFQHLSELKRHEKAQESAPQNRDPFFKILLNLEDSLDLVSGASDGIPSNWVRLNDTGTKSHRTKFIPLGEVSVGFLCFGLHNEYLQRLGNEP